MEEWVSRSSDFPGRQQQLGMNFQGESQRNKYTDLILLVSYLCFLRTGQTQLEAWEHWFHWYVPCPWTLGQQTGRVALVEQKEDHQHRSADEKVIIVASESQLKFTFLIYMKVLDFGTLGEKTGDILWCEESRIISSKIYLFLFCLFWVEQILNHDWWHKFQYLLLIHK